METMKQRNEHYEPTLPLVYKPTADKEKRRKGGVMKFDFEDYIIIEEEEIAKCKSVLFRELLSVATETEREEKREENDLTFE